MRQFLLRLFMLAALLTGSAAAQDAADGDAKQLCDSLSQQPLKCYVQWVPNSLSLASMGVAMGVQQGRKEFPGVASALDTEQKLFAYAMKTLKSGSAKAETLTQAHAFAQESLRAALPKADVTEKARDQGMKKRRAELEKMLEKLAG